MAFVATAYRFVEQWGEVRLQAPESGLRNRDCLSGIGSHGAWKGAGGICGLEPHAHAAASYVDVDADPRIAYEKFVGRQLRRCQHVATNEAIIVLSQRSSPESAQAALEAVAQSLQTGRRL